MQTVLGEWVVRVVVWEGADGAEAVGVELGWRVRSVDGIGVRDLGGVGEKSQRW